MKTVADGLWSDRLEIQLVHIAYMLTERTEPIVFRNDHDWWTKTSSVVASVTAVTQQNLHRNLLIQHQLSDQNN